MQENFIHEDKNLSREKKLFEDGKVMNKSCNEMGVASAIMPVHGLYFFM